MSGCETKPTSGFQLCEGRGKIEAFGGNRMERRRRPRALTLTLPDTEQPYLIFEGKRYALQNISDEGIGLWLSPPAPFGLHKGNQVNGNVVIDNEIYAIGLEVVRCSDQVVGLKIVNKSPELDAILKKLLSPALYAAEVTAHPQSGKVEPELGLPRLWYTGRSGTEVLIWYNPTSRNVETLQVCWAGKWALKHQQKSAESGYLRDVDEPHRGRLIRTEELLVKSRDSEIRVLQEASLFLAALPPPLPAQMLWRFLELDEEVILPHIASPR